MRIKIYYRVFDEKLNENQYNQIKSYLKKQRGNVKISNVDLMNAVLYMAENGCKGRALPEKFGNWHTIYMCIKRWAEKGVLERLFAGLQKENLIKISVTCLGLHRTSVKVPPDTARSLKKTTSINGKIPRWTSYKNS